MAKYGYMAADFDNTNILHTRGHI